MSEKISTDPAGISVGDELVASSRNGRELRYVVTGVFDGYIGVKKSTWWGRLLRRLRRFLRMS